MSQNLTEILNKKTFAQIHNIMNSTFSSVYSSYVYEEFFLFYIEDPVTHEIMHQILDELNDKDSRFNFQKE